MWCRPFTPFVLSALLAAFAVGNAVAQTAGSACSAGQLSGPNADGYNMICSGGVFVEVTGGGSPSADSLDFDDFVDAMALDASTDIAVDGSEVLSITNTGTGHSFVVNDQASDSSPFIISAAGYVGIGTTPGTNLDILGGVRVYSAWNDSMFDIYTQNGLDRVVLSSTAGSDITFWPGAGAAQKVHFDYDGNVGIGTTTPPYRLSVVSSTAGVVVASYQNGTGTCTFTPASSGSGTMSCSSDERLKKDITDAAVAALNYFGTMRIRDYTMKVDNSRQTGVVAQELLKTHPEMVHTGPDGCYTVDEPNKWMLVKAIQELKAANEKLAADNKAMRNDFEEYRRARP